MHRKAKFWSGNALALSKNNEAPIYISEIMLPKKRLKPTTTKTAAIPDMIASSIAKVNKSLVYGSAH